MNRKAYIGALLLLSGTLAGPLAGEARADVSDILDTAVGTFSAGFDYIWPGDVPLEDFTLRVGVGVGTTPDYVGSDDYRLRAIPLIDLRYKDVVALQGNKLKVNLLRRKNLKAGPLLNLKFGRKENRNPILAGMGNISNTVLAGAFVEGRYRALFGSAEIRTALGAGQGTTARFVLAQGLYQSKGNRFTMLAGLRADWNSTRSNQTNFGITPAQSVTSVLPSFAPGGGFSKTEIDLLGRYQLNEHWRLDGIAGYARLFGDAADSPLVATHGTADQFIIGVGTRYFF